MSKTTLTNLIHDAIKARNIAAYQANDLGVFLPEVQEAETLANNALEERINELIEAKVNQMLKRV